MLLSRVADHLYWMSRYLERAEHTARLMDVGLNLMLEQAPDAAERRWKRVLESLHIPLEGAHDSYAITERVAFDVANDNSILNCIASARENAQHVRELISSEMWEQLNQLYLQARRTRIDDIWYSNPHTFFRSVKEGAHLFQGLTDSTMTQGEGWLFIQVGRLIERASSIAMLLDVHMTAFAGETQDLSADYLEWVGLLKSCTAFEAYCKVYTADLRADRVAEFLLLNGDFPHSLCFAAIHLQSCLHQIMDITETNKAARLNKLAGRLRAMLEFAQIDEMMPDLHDNLSQVQTLCGQIHTAIYNTYITYPIERELMP